MQAYKSTEGRSFFSWCQIDRMYQSPNFIFNEIVEWYSLLIKMSFRIAVSKFFLRFLPKLLKKMHLPEIHACNSIHVKRVQYFLTLLRNYSFFLLLNHLLDYHC